MRAAGTGLGRSCLREPALRVIIRKSCHVTRHWAMSKRRSGRQEEASSQQIEPGPAIHVPFQHLQPINLPFDRALTPGQGDGGLDGAVIRTKSSGKTPEGRQGALGGTCQPRVELGRLALTDEGGEVLREGHGLCQLRGLLSQLRQLAVIVIRGAR